VQGGNDEVLRALDAFPGRLVGAAVVNPHYPGEMEGELERVFAHPAVRMIKVHHEFHAYPLDGPAYAPVWSFAEARQIPVLSHTWGEGRGYDHPEQGERVARAHPRMPLILAHSGGTVSGLMASVAAARRTANLYLDTATSLAYRGAVELLVRGVGPERVLFGSDATYLADPPQVAKVVYARLPDADKEAILGHNLQRLLGDVGHA
jgi:predicted TIM-barrel fold metal-dependent hydrolase